MSGPRLLYNFTVPRFGVELPQALHRARERVVKARTALVNEIRGLLTREYGIVLPQSVTKFRNGFLATLEAERVRLTALSQEHSSGNSTRNLAPWRSGWRTIPAKLEAISAAHPVCQRLGTIPGLGRFTSTAMVAAVSDITHFQNGRQFAAWIGLVPRQHSTGGKPRLLGISKRGDVYLSDPAHPRGTRNAALDRTQDGSPQ